MRSHLLLLVLLTVSGCSHWDGQLPFVSYDADRQGTKMLRPGARATTCRTRVFGLGLGPDGAPVESVLDELRAMDAEANGLLNLRMHVSGFSLGIIQRVCATAVADVVRTTPVVLVPTTPGVDHQQHH